jgi:uncharacterized protein (TIGR02680 family)
VRWQPLRIGLTDLFYYDQEEFAFRDGRLLLRGNNGTGKSKVLALTLPFLLDGELSPHRIEPDADPKKKMEWNLLLGGEHPHNERLGYTWLEFGRAGGEGPEFCTIGCGMKAVAGRGISAHWFFVTDRRIGDDLALVDHTGVALTHDRLVEGIGTRGGVHKRRRDYRRAVDERLFGLGEQRYGALVDLLVKIRQPQLSKRPDERGLSAALTDALPPLDQGLLHNVAEAFRALEDDAAELEAMVAAHGAADRYLQTYRAYARMATRRRAEPLRQTQTAFDRLSRELAEGGERLRLAVTELAAAREHLATLRTEHARLSARLQTLRDDPLARSARDLRRAADDADQARRERDDLDAALERAAETVASRRERLAAAERELEQATDALEQIQRAATQHAHGAAIDGPFTEALAAREPAALPRVVDDLVARQQRGVARVRTLARELEGAERELATARQATERQLGELAETTERRDASRTAVAERGAHYVRDARTHLQAVTELELTDPAAAFGALEEWLQTLSGPNPLEQAISAAAQQAVRRLERAVSEAGARAEQTRGVITELAREAAELEAGIHPIPPAPPTRAPEVRAGRAGAPLWQLTEFHDSVAEARRAGIEAALEASGILDGWVTPAGELLDPHTEDALLAASDLRAAAGPRLSDVITPATIDVAENAGVAAADVGRLLDAIGLGDGDGTVWVADDGRFRNGALRGAWHKPAAQFIGHAAREAARRARLAELATALAEARDGLATIEAELALLTERHEQLNREFDRRPLDATVRDAYVALSAAEAELRAAQGRLDAARGGEERAHLATEQARSTLAGDATDLGLPPGGEALEAVEAALARFEIAVATLWPAGDRTARAERALADVRADAEEAERGRAITESRRTEVEHRLVAAVERRDTLQASAGAAIEQLERQTREVSEAVRANVSAQDLAEERLGAAQRGEGVAEAHERELQEQLERSSAERVTAVDGLRRFANTGLIAVALSELGTPEEWNVTQALRLAREIEQALAADPDEDARWARLQRRVSDELGPLADALRRHGNDAAMFPRDEGIVVEVTFQGQTKTLPELTAGLGEEVEHRQRLLGSREREILENHLVGEVASALQELIVAAEAGVQDTNQELAARPTSTGMQLRLRWSPDPEAPDGLADARRRLLRQSTDAWSEEDRAAVGEFLQHRIDAIRAEDVTATWIERLTLAFDYRHWHRFTVERRQGDSWHSASGPSSGGERVLAASVPLFAAASSYYSSANPNAPRLIMLDEAFAGVDDRARAKCLGLLAAFDLDVVMTSEREWGCYAEVPGLAIAQLSRTDGVAAVLVSRWEWDGSARHRIDSPPEPPTVIGVAPSEGPLLWDTSTTSD